MSQKIKQSDDIVIGRNIGILRAEKGITQEGMATQLQLKGISISRGTYSKIEMGTRHIEANCLEAIRDILGTTYERLLAHTGETETPE